MPIKTLDIDELALQAGTMYEAIVILSKRARQVSTNIKSELDEKLSYFEGFETDIDDVRMVEEQSRISLEYERRPKATEVAIHEMFDHEIYFRRPGEEPHVV